MGKLFLRLIGIFSKLEGGKHQVGSEAEVGESVQKERKIKVEGTFWRDIFPGSNARLQILLGCLVCFFSAFCGRGKNRPCLHSIL